MMMYACICIKNDVYVCVCTPNKVGLFGQRWHQINKTLIVRINKRMFGAPMLTVYTYSSTCNHTNTVKSITAYGQFPLSRDKRIPCLLWFASSMCWKREILSNINMLICSLKVTRTKNVNNFEFTKKVSTRFWT